MVWTFIVILATGIVLWILFGPTGLLRELLNRFVKAITGTVSHTSTFLSNNERRWVVIGICLAKVLTPALRNILATEIPKWHQVLCQPPTEIDKQVFCGHQKKLPPSTLNLNYKNINNNDSIATPGKFDYAVKDPLSLAKLFVQPFMSKFTGFDITMDTSAVLSLIAETAPFARAATYAKKVRSNIRNEWAHCNFARWTEQNVTDAFQDMENLIKNLNLTADDELKFCDELNRWKEFQLCLDQGVNIEMLTLLRGEVDELCEAVKTWKLEKRQITTLASNITNLKLNLSKQIDDLRTIVEELSEKVENIEKKITSNELSRINIKEEEKIPRVFTAPSRNRCFSGRKEEIQELKRILKVEETLNEKKVRVAVVCGLGGIGKTSLVSEYAHQMEDFYNGGVYWFSAENDTSLDMTVNDIALKLNAILGSFDLTLSNTLRKIGTTNDPSLIVLDCLDDLELSSNMRKFLTFPLQENFFGHFVVLTRRNPNRLFNEVSVFEDGSCLQLECLQSADAKQFLFSRTDVIRDENVESVAECLCEELGRLPLALEQAGAYIQMRGCSFSVYLKQYKAERLRLLRRKRARPAGKDSDERLAVHTTWLINIEYMKKSQDGPAAVRFMNACSFFDGHEIEKELINVGKPEVKDAAYRKCVSSSFGCHEVLGLLTDFSLFTYVEARSVTTHRLVQELIWENLSPEARAESFADAVRMLSFVFSKCASPSSLVNFDEINGQQQNILSSDLPKSYSHYYMWSKFCMHGHCLRKKMEDFVETLDSVWFPETAKILYECAVHLSANHKQEEAMRILNFGYRVLDWLPLEEYETVGKNVSNNSLFPLSIPLPNPIQILIKQCSVPPFVPLQCLTEKPGAFDLDNLKRNIEKLRSDGKKCFKEGRYKDALDAYSSAIDLAQDCNSACYVFLLTNRASVYIKLEQYENALKDANEYITRCPDCWKGYARKALALVGLNEKVSAEIAAALASYHASAIFSDFPPFKKCFSYLQERIFICDTVDELQKAILSQEVETGIFKILVLGSDEYVLNSDTLVQTWNHCILVGTKKNRSVSLKSDYVIPLLKCMLTNLSFYFNNSQLHGICDSFVKILNCNFISCYDEIERSVVKTEGDLSAEKCNFMGSNDAGLECVGPANGVLVDCSFYKNRNDGVRVSENATVTVKSCHMHNNGRDGLCILESKTSEIVAIKCDINHNCNAGISIFNSENVKLIRNRIFGNNGCGIFMVNPEATIGKNDIFDNAWWGIWSQSNTRCNISINRVFRNKGGGIRVGCRDAGNKVSPSVVEQNKIYENIGPAFVENVHMWERVNSWKPTKIKDVIEKVMQSHLNSPNSFKSAILKNNVENNNKENENVGQPILSVSYCSDCRVKCKLTMCPECFTTSYCSTFCKGNHSSKHKILCKVLREKSSCLITSMATFEDEKDRKTSRHRKMFVVKVHSVHVPMLGNPWSLCLILRNRNVQLGGIFDSKVVKKQVKEFGALCKPFAEEKQLFFNCLFEGNGQLRLITNEFAKFERW